MTGGKILSFDRQGNYLLKFTGDVRMTLCGSLNGHIDRILGGEGVERVVIDMLSAEGLDSTTLGLLAKLGLHCRKNYGFNVEIFCLDKSILRTLESMSFDEIFDIFDRVPHLSDSDQLSEIEAPSSPADDLRQQVLEAHRILVTLSESNQREFEGVIQALESEA